MVSGHDHLTKVHYKGNDDDFIVFVESAAAVQDWRKDKSIPLAQVVNGFKIFVSALLDSIGGPQLTNILRSRISMAYNTSDIQHKTDRVADKVHRACLTELAKAL